MEIRTGLRVYYTNQDDPNLSGWGRVVWFQPDVSFNPRMELRMERGDMIRCRLQDVTEKETRPYIVRGFERRWYKVTYRVYAEDSERAEENWRDGEELDSDYEECSDADVDSVEAEEPAEPALAISADERSEE